MPKWMARSSGQNYEKVELAYKNSPFYFSTNNLSNSHLKIKKTKQN